MNLKKTHMKCRGERIEPLDTLGRWYWNTHDFTNGLSPHPRVHIDGVGFIALALLELFQFT
jgi:hypothetical protein